MAKYRKKPVVVEAIQWTGNNLEEIHKFVGKNLLIHTRYDELVNLNVVEYIEIKTLEGDHLAKAGDYIIKGVQGEFYPCKPDIFLETYEEVKENGNLD